MGHVYCADCAARASAAALGAAAARAAAARAIAGGPSASAKASDDDAAELLVRMHLNDTGGHGTEDATLDDASNATSAPVAEKSRVSATPQQRRRRVLQHAATTAVRIGMDTRARTQVPASPHTRRVNS